MLKWLRNMRKRNRLRLMEKWCQEFPEYVPDDALELAIFGDLL